MLKSNVLSLHALSSIYFHFCILAKQIEKGYKFKTGLTLYPTYQISFEFYAVSFEKQVAESIIHFTATNNNCCNSGDRLIGLWTPGTGTAVDSNSLLFINEINGKANNALVTSKKYHAKQWINVVITQRVLNGKYVLTVVVNSEVIREMENTSPQVFENVIVYVSDPWYIPLQGTIRNIKIETGKHISCLIK